MCYNFTRQFITCFMYFVFFFFKQKTAYEMRISDWSSDVCSSDLWDYDLGSQPTLIDFPTARGNVPAVVLASKQGDIYVLDRQTGEPLFPVEERDRKSVV